MNRAWSPHGRGSGKLVAEEERERLVDAFTKVVSERGSGDIDVGDITREAHLPAAAFDRHFENLRQCYIAAYDDFCDRLTAEIEDSMTPGAPWRKQVESGIHAAISFVIESATIARVFAIEGPSLGPPVMNRYIAAIERIVNLLRLGRRQASDAGPPPLSEAIFVAGAFSLVTGALLAEEHADLPDLEAGLIEVATLLTPD